MYFHSIIFVFRIMKVVISQTIAYNSTLKAQNLLLKIYGIVPLWHLRAGYQEPDADCAWGRAPATVHATLTGPWPTPPKAVPQDPLAGTHKGCS